MIDLDKQPGDDADDDGGDDEDPPPEPSPGAARVRAPGRLVRTGSILLAAMGALSLVLVVPGVLSPENVRCTEARVLIDEANDDDDADNDVEIDGEDADDVPCEQAIELANGIPDEADVRSESAIRQQYTIVSVIGLIQVAGGILMLRYRTLRARTIALVAAALGLPFFGIISLLLFGFVAYALVFSADARTMFGEPRFLRPRGPAPREE